LLSRWVDAFVVPSAFLGRMLVRAGIPWSRVHVVPNGIALSARPMQPSERRFALYIGRLSSEKGIDTLLEAARLAPDVPLAVAGDGPLKARVQASGVEYLGQLDRGGVDAHLREAAFVVVPSVCHENFPNVVLESLAAGRAVIATRMGGLPEMLRPGETGVLLPPGDAPALADAMRELWLDPPRTARMGREARDDAARFSISLHAQRMTDLYTRVSSRALSPSPCLTSG
jgi:glycosyltransferase involved in cell wall biosynthesis